MRYSILIEAAMIVFFLIAYIPALEKGYAFIFNISMGNAIIYMVKYIHIPPKSLKVVMKRKIS